MADASKADAYQRHAMATVFPALRDIPGHRGAYLLRRVTGERTEFLAVTLWDSIDAIHAFAGAERAVVEPEARAVLAEFDDVARHYEVAYDSLSAPPSLSPARARVRGA
ncbi:MAG TPA: antibiotic biosynthesis monooxygenase [Stellaceae bacterium]|nr:antibiotic biosynthesis monooxygenase [Stellaceae bacterium]